MKGSDESSAISRVFDAVGCRTQQEMANLLKIRQTFVSDALRRKIVPVEWLVKLAQCRNVNPDWIMTGKGNKFLVLWGQV